MQLLRPLAGELLMTETAIPAWPMPSKFAKPTDSMIDSAYEAVRFDEAWAINSRRDFVKAVKAMVRKARDMHLDRKQAPSNR